MKYSMRDVVRDVGQSHPSRGAWIEIGGGQPMRKQLIGRTPRGVRGLKLLQLTAEKTVCNGRTPRGVRGLKFMEGGGVGLAEPGRTPRGVRGLKYLPSLCVCAPILRRTPRGVRGLK